MGGSGSQVLKSRFQSRRIPLLSVLFSLLMADCSSDRLVPSPAQGGAEAGVHLTAADSQLVWAVPGPGGFGEPTVGDDVVFFLAEDHSVHAIDKGAGKERWSVALPIQPSLLPGLASVLLPGRLIVPDQDVFSLDPATGAIQWRFQAPFGRRPGYDAPAVGDSLLYFGSGSGHLFAIEQSTGRLRWARSVGDTTDAVFRPVIANGVVYVGVTLYPPSPGVIGSRIVALDAASGDVRWTRDLPSLVDKPAAGTRNVLVAGSLLYATSGDGIVHALDVATGQTRWTASRAAPPLSWGLPSPAEYDSRGLALDGNRLYVASATGLIVAVSPVDGVLLWTSPANFGAVFDLRCDGRSVFAVGAFGPLTVIDATTGAVRWGGVATARNEKFRGTASFDAQNLYVNGSRGFYAFRKERTP
jgi:outer membrane protein assembly factor BamB